MPLTLEQWLARIDAIHQEKWDPGLTRISQVAAKLSLRKPATNVITVAGTNGKGSTVELIDTLGRAAGLTVGKTTSPHFHRFNERIVVNGEPVSDKLVIAAFEEIDAVRGDVTITYFEFAALAALKIFSEQQLDVAVLEIGLGGRLDAFNIVDADVAVITRIALDHQSWLGNTRDEIGREKAGILRADQVCILNDPAPPVTVLEVAEEVGTTLFRCGHDFRLLADAVELPNGKFPLPAQMSLPRESAAAALAALEVIGYQPDPATFTQVCQSAALPGRWQHLGEQVLVDVAHNPDAAQYLADRLQAEHPGQRIHAVVGMYADKDIAGVFSILLPMIDRWHLCSVDEARAASTDELETVISGLSATPFVMSYVKVMDAYNAAVDSASPDDLVLVFGSFPVIAAVLAGRGEIDS